jgi:hypothetical protein
LGAGVRDAGDAGGFRFLPPGAKDGEASAARSAVSDSTLLLTGTRLPLSFDRVEELRDMGLHLRI